MTESPPARKGATLSGRALAPLPFDGRRLGPHFADLRPPLPAFTLFGGMMVDRTDIGHLLSATRRPPSFVHSLRLVGRYLRDRLRYRRGTRLVMGNALVGQLYLALRERQAPVRLSTTPLSILQEDGRVIGAVFARSGASMAVRARVGVVLATGGFSRDPALRRRLLPAAPDGISPVVESATGDGLRLACSIGGHLAPEHSSNSFWAPVSRWRRRDGSVLVFPHFVLDRGKPGMIAIDPAGRRFVNEAITYHLFGEALLATLGRHPGRACHLICDDAAIERYGLGMVRPKRMNLSAALKDGYVTRSETLDELAAKIGVPADPLHETIARHDGFAATGVDEDFAKGEDA